jgi:hypothetical protein
LDSIGDSTFFIGNYQYIKDFPTAARILDIFYLRNHKDPPLFQFHVLLCKGKSAGSHTQLSSVIIEQALLLAYF